MVRDIYELITDNIISDVPEELRNNMAEKKLKFLIKIDLLKEKDKLLSNKEDKLPYQIPLSWLSPEKAVEIGYVRVIDHEKSKQKISLNYPAISFALANLTSVDGKHIRSTMARLESPFFRLKVFLLPLILTSLANMPILASFLCLCVSGGYLIYLGMVWAKFFYFKNSLISLAKGIGTFVEVQISAFALYVCMYDPDFEGKKQFGEMA